MNPSLIAILLLALTFFSAGIAIGGYFFSFKKPANLPRPTPPPDLPAADSLTPPAARPVSHPDLQEIVRLFRHRPTHKLIAEINGQARAAGQPLTPEQHSSLSLAIVDLADWLGTPLNSPAAPPATTAPASPTSPPTTANTPPTTSNASAAPVLEPPSTNPLQALRALNNLRASASQGGVASLAGRINIVLQELLDQSELRDSIIEMRDAPGGGAAFYVRGASYEFMDQIPDPAVQALFQRAIQEWERRNARDL